MAVEMTSMASDEEVKGVEIFFKWSLDLVRRDEDGGDGLG